MLAYRDGVEVRTPSGFVLPDEVVGVIDYGYASTVRLDPVTVDISPIGSGPNRACKGSLEQQGSGKNERSHGEWAFQVNDREIIALIQRRNNLERSGTAALYRHLDRLYHLESQHFYPLMVMHFTRLQIFAMPKQLQKPTHCHCVATNSARRDAVKTAPFGGFTSGVSGTV